MAFVVVACIPIGLSQADGEKAARLVQQVFSAASAVHAAAPAQTAPSGGGRDQRDQQQQQQRAQQGEQQAEWSGSQPSDTAGGAQQSDGGHAEGSLPGHATDEAGGDEVAVPTTSASSDPLCGHFQGRPPQAGDFAAEAAACVSEGWQGEKRLAPAACAHDADVGQVTEQKKEQKQEPIQRAAAETQGSSEVAGGGVACRSGEQLLFERTCLVVDRAAASGKGKGHSSTRSGTSIRAFREAEVGDEAQGQAGQGEQGAVGIAAQGQEGQGEQGEGEVGEHVDECATDGDDSGAGSIGSGRGWGTAAAADPAADTSGSGSRLGRPGRAKPAAGGGSRHGDDEAKEQRAVKNLARARLPSGDFAVPASVGSGGDDRARLPSGDFIVPASVGSGVRGVVDSNTKQEKKD